MSHLSAPSPASAVPASGRQTSTGAPEHLVGVRDFTVALRYDFTSYLFSLGLLQLGNLLVLPLVTAHLTGADVGLYSLVEAALLQGMTLSLLGLKFAYLYYYAQMEPAQRQRLLGTCLSMTVIASLAVGLLLTMPFSSAPIMGLFDSATLPHAWLLMPLLLTGAVQTVLLTELRAARRVWLSGLIAATQMAIHLLLAWLLIAGYRAGLTGLLSAQALAQAISCLASFILLRRRIAAALDVKQAGRLLRYGLPMMTGLTLRYSLDTLCRFLLAALVSIEAAGLFLIISAISALFEAVIANPFYTAWGGLVHHALRRPEAGSILGRVTSIALAAGSAAFLLILACQPLLFTLLAHDPMPEAAGAFALLLLSRLVMLVRSPLTGGLLRTGRTGWAVSNTLLALAIFGILIYPAATYAGLAGMAGTLLLANVVASAALTLAAWRHCPQRLEPAALLLGLLAAAATILTLLQGGMPPWPWGILLPAALFLLFRLGRHIHVNDRL
ncbi:MAG: lipopolysaccharide biosynthesis protein [Ferrovibrio sp.]|uniref:lipopolysaccharide biosynthesis protein n=1 Tax=Ferrovibrio sp. TaxID=1917215 RepID=UPI00391D563D